MGYKYCSYIRIWSDGSSQRNKMGVGVVLRPGMEPKIYKEIYGLIDPVENTQNHFVAEWASIVVALNLCLPISGLKRIDLYNDNQTVIDQMNGKARIRKIHLAKLHAEATRLIHILREQGVQIFKFYHVNKRHNSYADSLSQKAIEGEEIRLNIWVPLESPIVDPITNPETSEPEPSDLLPLKPDPHIPTTDNLEDKAEREEQSKLMKEFIAEKKAIQEAEQHVDDGPGFVASTTLDDMEPGLTEDSSLKELEIEQQRIKDLIGDKRVEEAVNIEDLRTQEKKEPKKSFAGLKI